MPTYTRSAQCAAPPPLPLREREVEKQNRNIWALQEAHLAQCTQFRKLESQLHLRFYTSFRQCSEGMVT